MFMYLLKRCLVFCILFFSTSISLSFQPQAWCTNGYNVIITLDLPAKKAHVEIRKNNILVSSIDLTFTKHLFHKPLGQIAKHFALPGQRDNLRIHLKQGNNYFKLKVTPLGGIVLEKLEMAESFCLSMQGHKPFSVIRANTTMRLNNNFGIDATRGYFESDVGSFWQVGGQTNLHLPHGKIVIGGKLESKKNITIKTGHYLQPYGDVTQIYGKEIQAVSKHGKPWTCVEYDEIAPERSWVGSTQESLNIAANRIGIYGGVAQAKDYIVADVRSVFNLISKYVEQARCSTYRDGWNSVKKAERTHHMTWDPAVLSAGKDFLLTLGDRRFQSK